MNQYYISTLVLLISFLLFYAEYKLELSLPKPYQDFKITYSTPDFNDVKLEGIFEPNFKLQNSLNLFQNQITNPETIIFDDNDAMYMFCEEGIFKANKKSNSNHPLDYDDPILILSSIDGRPLSGVFDHDYNTIYYCNLSKGLMKFDLKLNKTTVLLNSIINNNKTSNIAFCDDIALSSQNEIYFTDATALQPQSNIDALYVSILAAYQGGSYGRVIKYDILKNESEIISLNYRFANGISLSNSEDYLIVADSFSNKIYKIKDKIKEVIINALPGFPDGVSRSTESSEDFYWIALDTPTSLILWLSIKSRIVRWLCCQLTSYLPIQDYGHIIKINRDGVILDSLQDPSGFIKSITSVIEFKNYLFLGSIKANFVTAVELSIKLQDN